MNFFLSYPKSGRTWVRFLLASYLCRLHRFDCRQVFEVENSHPQGGIIRWTHLTGQMVRRLPYWSMGCLDRQPLAGASAVLLVRSFPDTLASAYDQAVHRIQIFSGTPSAFLRSPLFGVAKLVTFYNLWEELTPSFGRSLLLSYDEMRQDPLSPMRKLLRFWEIPLDEPLLASIVEASSIDEMRRLSLTPEYAGTCLAPTDPTNPASFKVRAGGSVRSSALFSAEDLAYIDSVVSALLIDSPAARLAQDHRPVPSWNSP